MKAKIGMNSRHFPTCPLTYIMARHIGDNVTIIGT